jgi:hypothetical protein
MESLSVRAFRATEAPPASSCHLDLHEALERISEPLASSLLRHPELWAAGSASFAALPAEHDSGRNVFESVVSTGSCSVALGGSLGDAFAAVHVLLQASSLMTDSVLLLESDEGDLGDFLLAEAAEALPEWCCPEVMAYRVALFRGQLLIVPPAPLTTGLDRLSRSQLNNLWDRYGLRGTPPVEQGSQRAWDDASETNNDTGDVENVVRDGGVGTLDPGRLLRFFGQVVLPACVAASSASTAQLHNAVMRSIARSVVNGRVASKCAQEAAVLLSPQRVCVVLPPLAAAAICFQPELAVRAANAFLEAMGEVNFASVAARMLSGSPMLPAVDLTNAPPQQEASAVGSDPVRNPAATCRVATLLPRYTFSALIFTQLPLPDSNLADPDACRANPSYRVADMSLKLGLGLAILHRTKEIDSDVLQAAASGEVQVTQLPLDDFGDSVAWMEVYATEAAKEEAGWLKDGMLDALEARMAEDAALSSSHSSSSSDEEDRRDDSDDDDKADDAAEMHTWREAAAALEACFAADDGTGPEDHLEAMLKTPQMRTLFQAMQRP